MTSQRKALLVNSIFAKIFLENPRPSEEGNLIMIVEQKPDFEAPSADIIAHCRARAQEPAVPKLMVLTDTQSMKRRCYEEMFMSASEAALPPLC